MIQVSILSTCTYTRPQPEMSTGQDRTQERTEGGEGEGRWARESWSTRESRRAWYSRASWTASASSSPSWEQRRSSASSATRSLSHALCSSFFICSSLSWLFLSSFSSSSFLFLNDVASFSPLSLLLLLPPFPSPNTPIIPNALSFSLAVNYMPRRTLYFDWLWFCLPGL
jgi:hypothetical protein